MYQIAIVEDEVEYAGLLKKYLNKFGQEKNVEFQTRCFTNAISLLDNYKADYDLIFMDINMPFLNGMDAAHKLRALDSDVLLIFITNLAQYAIKGYEVDALDYILKPVSYFDFALKLSRAMLKLNKNFEHQNIVLTTTTGKVRLRLDDIYYIETSGHYLIYHTAGQKTYTQYTTMKSAAEKLEKHHFARCNNCYLVNLKYVKNIKGYTATVGNEQLQISQPRKKEFLNRFIAYSAKK